MFRLGGVTLTSFICSPIDIGAWTDKTVPADVLLPEEEEEEEREEEEEEEEEDGGSVPDGLCQFESLSRFARLALPETGVRFIGIAKTRESVRQSERKPPVAASRSTIPIEEDSNDTKNPRNDRMLHPTTGTPRLDFDHTIPLVIFRPVASSLFLFSAIASPPTLKSSCPKRNNVDVINQAPLPRLKL
ncbi:hypothetical protein V1477_018589 [Vespula maculifrons]|uniref:Uncharacterized protein n=1 Tax=Vespula maculifrons TaxID=7453 RepID=A0ABD2AVT0_VESMC